MPNDCLNNLEVSGNKAEVEDFMKKISDSDKEVCFDILLPSPSDTKDILDWNVDNYGTKWNGYESQFNDEYVSFFTAWSPPLNFFDTVSKKYPDLTFTLTCFEPGCDFFGITIFNNGSRIRDDWDICDSELSREIFGNEFVDSLFYNEDKIQEELEEI